MFRKEKMNILEKKYDEYDIASPNPGALIQSMRAFGYDISTAIADIVDNSIAAGARNIRIEFYWDDTNSRIAIIDDGKGMSEEELINAMRLGSKSPLEERSEDDLGRFGLGMKTASFSQCNKLTVATKQQTLESAVRSWDLDYISKVNCWNLLKSKSIIMEKYLTRLNEMSSGTVVLWENIDSIVSENNDQNLNPQKFFYEKASDVKKHVALTFCDFLAGRNALTICINDRRVEPWDPFLSSHPATIISPTEELYIDNKLVRVTPYILPHHSKLTAEEFSLASGTKGWNAQQGFYIYRNKRLIVAGSWMELGYKKEEHCKLARIRIDIDNRQDKDWDIDVRKAKATPPSAIVVDLKRIAKLARLEATRIYRHRGKKIARTFSGEERHYVWEQKVRHGKIFYKINRKYPFIDLLLKNKNISIEDIRKAIKLIEETVPIPLIVSETNENPEKMSQPYEGVKSEEIFNMMESMYECLKNEGMSKKRIIGILSFSEPFIYHEELIATFIDGLEKKV